MILLAAVGCRREVLDVATLQRGGSVSINVAAVDPPRLEVLFDTPLDGCPRPADDLAVTFAGRPLVDLHDGECPYVDDYLVMSLDDPAATPADLVIADGTGTLVIGLADPATVPTLTRVGEGPVPQGGTVTLAWSPPSLRYPDDAGIELVCFGGSVAGVTHAEGQVVVTLADDACVGSTHLEVVSRAFDLVRTCPPGLRCSGSIGHIEGRRTPIDIVAAAGAAPGPPGLGAAFMADEIAAALGVRGVAVAEVGPGSSAAASGLLGLHRGADGNATVGDVIVAVDGIPVAEKADLLALFAKRAIGDEVILRVTRDGAVREVTVKLQAG